MHKTELQRRDMFAVTAAVVATLALPASAATDEPVVAPIQHLVGGLEQVMKAGSNTPFQQRFDLLGPVIDQAFDLPAILQESVGASWETLPPEQQTMLAGAFRRYTVASYVNSFDNYTGQRFEISPATRSVGSDQVVQTKIIPKKGDSHELDYVMRETSDGWRVVDVLADGSISRVAVQRSDFRRLLTRGGAQALAESLRTKSANLSDGSS